MAVKKHLEQYDKNGTQVPIYLNADEVNVGNQTLEEKLEDIEGEIEEAGEYTSPQGGIPANDLAGGIPKSKLDDNVKSSLDKADSAVQGVIFNGAEVAKDPTTKKVTFEQVQPNWNETNQNSKGFIANKPSNIVTNVFYEQSTRKFWKNSSNGGVQEIMTLPEPSVQVQIDDQLANTDNLVKNRAVKAAIDSLQNSLNTLIGSGNVQGAIDTFNEITAFLNGINTTDPTLRNQLLALDNAITALQTTLEGKLGGIKKADGTSLPVTNGVVTLPLIPTQQDISAAVEDAMEYYERPETVVINSDGANINDNVSDSILTAPSSRMMKEVYLNLRALFDSTNGLAGIAFLNGKPDWQTVDVPKHTITLGTMSNVSASLNETSINDNIAADEGEVTILLTPSNNNYMSSISIKDGSNHDVNFTRNDVSGGTEITFILYSNVTISAIASSGIQVNVSGDGITSYSTGVPPSTAAELTIVLPAHRTWGTVAITYGNDNITSHCDISLANNANKVIILPDNLSDTNKVISIVANAVEDDFAVLDLTNVGNNVSVMRGSENLLTQQTPLHVYAGETISILPVGNNKVDATVTIGSTEVTLTGDTYSGYSYTLISNDVNSQGTSMAIVADATGLSQCAITLPTVGNGIASVALTDLEDNAIEPSNNVYSVLENTGIKVVITPDTDYALSADSTNMAMTNSAGTWYNESTANDGVLTITIEHVAGAVTVALIATREIRPVHKYLHVESTDEQGRPCFLDQTGNGFHLYPHSVISGITSNSNYPYYGNGRYYGVNGSTLRIPQNGSFTVFIKNHKLSDNGAAGYSTTQIRITTNDALTDGTYQNGAHYSNNTGVYSIGFTTDSGAFSATHILRILTPNAANTTVSGSFSDITASVGVKASYAIVYDASTNTITAYKDGTKTQTPITTLNNWSFRGICIRDKSTGQKNDFAYDYISFYDSALSDADVATLFNP